MEQLRVNADQISQRREQVNQARRDAAAGGDTDLMRHLDAEEREYQRQLDSLNAQAAYIQGTGIRDTKPIRPTYASFGRHNIHLGHLDDGVLHLAYRSGTRNPKMERVKMSDALQETLKHAISGGRIDSRKAHALNETDQSLLSRLCHISRVECPLPEFDDEDSKRFELLVGSVNAGNTSPDVLKELKRLLLKFQGEGRVTPTQAAKLLFELSV